MHVRTQLQKLVLALGLEQARLRKKQQKVIEVVNEAEDRREGCRDIGGAHDRLLEKLEGKAHLREEATPHQLGGEKIPETETNRDETSIEVGSVKRELIHRSSPCPRKGEEEFHLLIHPLTRWLD